MVEMLEYAPYLVTDAQEILGSGQVEAIAAALRQKQEAMGGLGGSLGRDKDRVGQLAERIEDARDRLAEHVQRAASGGEDYEPSDVSNVLVGLGNLHIAIGSSVARGGLARNVSWAMDGLAKSNSGPVFQQLQPHLVAALTAEWHACAVAQSVAGSIEAIFAYELPERVHAHPLRDSELAGLQSELEAAFGAVTSYAPAATGRDDSTRMAEWLQVQLDPQAAAPAAAAEPGAAGGAQAEFDWSAVDLAAMHAANQRVCKDARSSDRLAFVGLTFLFCVGPDHPQELLRAIAAHPDSYSGTVQVRSARIGAGTIVVSGAPADQRPNVEWAIGQFSRKDVEFA